MPPQQARKKRSRRLDGYKLGLLHDLRRILLVAAGLVAVFCLLFGFSRVDGESMLDTFQNGELVFYSRINGQIGVGDVVSVHLASGEYYIKRVVAVGGDEIDLRDGVLYVNGAPEEAGYVRNATYPEEGIVTYPYTVPEGDVFVMGDNREGSTDSRTFGSVSTRQVRGVIRFSVGWLYWHWH